jgi:hypothetical protein
MGIKKETNGLLCDVYTSASRSKEIPLDKYDKN